jgi:hypothetical protein
MSNRWTPNGVAAYSSVKTWLVLNTRTKELRYADCVTRLELLATGFNWTTCHAVEFYT